jgi:hypothetical protein
MYHYHLTLSYGLTSFVEQVQVDEILPLIYATGQAPFITDSFVKERYDAYMKNGNLPKVGTEIKLAPNFIVEVDVIKQPTKKRLVIEIYEGEENLLKHVLKEHGFKAETL